MSHSTQEETIRERERESERGEERRGEPLTTVWLPPMYKNYVTVQLWKKKQERRERERRRAQPVKKKFGISRGDTGIAVP